MQLSLDLGAPASARPRRLSRLRATATQDAEARVATVEIASGRHARQRARGVDRRCLRDPSRVEPLRRPARTWPRGSRRRTS